MRATLHEHGVGIVALDQLLQAAAQSNILELTDKKFLHPLCVPLRTQLLDSGVLSLLPGLFSDAADHLEKFTAAAPVCQTAMSGTQPTVNTSTAGPTTTGTLSQRGDKHCQLPPSS